MIFDAANLKCGHSSLPRNSTDIRLETLLYLSVNEINSALCAEHDVIKQIRIRVGHKYRPSLTRRDFVQPTVG